MDNQGAFNEIQRTLGRLEGKLEAVHDSVETLAVQGQALNGRVDRLESARDTGKGYKAALLGISGLIAAAVSVGWKVFFE